MLARRVIAISPDKAFSRRLSLGLKAAGGSVETYPSLDAMARGGIQAALVVVHLDGELRTALPEVAERLRKDAWIIAVLPKSNLVDTVSTMQGSDRVAGVLIADQFSAEALASMTTRVLYGDIFGLEKVVNWGTKVYSTLVGDYQEKSVCIAQISEYAALMGVRRKYREAIEQCVDEMLMNALYDAPVDASGKQLFADIPTKTRISLRMEQKAVVQYSCNGETFTVSVRDSFGTLDRSTIVRYLHKCLHSEQQIDRKTGGAGLGLYIIANTTTLMIFNVLPGVATECVCNFDLTAPKVQLKRFGYFNEKIDPAGRLVGGQSKLVPTGTRFPVERREGPPPSNKGVTLALGGAIVLLLALIALVAYPRFMTKPTSAIHVTSQPVGASIEVDGDDRGVTGEGPLVLDSLEVDRTYKITASRVGWEPVTRYIKPVKGNPTMVAFQLSGKATMVQIDSDPQGVEVYYDGAKRGVTPFSDDGLPSSQEIELVFRKTGYVEAKRKLKVPGPGGQASLSHSLQMARNWGSVRITSEPGDATIYQNGTLQAKTTPVEEHLVPANKEQRFTIKKPGFMPVHVKVRVKAGERGVPVEAALKPGGGLTVTGQGLEQALVTVVGVKRCSKRRLPLEDCALPDGEYKVRVDSPRPYLRTEFPVVINKNEVTHELKLGFVSTPAPYRLVLGRKRTAGKAAFPEGKRNIVLVNTVTKERQTIEVRIQVGRTITLP